MGFFHPEEIPGSPTVHYFRWMLLRLRSGRAIYLHHFVGNDRYQDPHDHPKRFISIGLWGRYDEDVLNVETGQWTTTHWKAPWIRSFPARHIHRIRSKHLGGAWTLVFVGKKRRAWGFWLPSKVYGGTWFRLRKWVPKDQYVALYGAERKEC